MTTPGALPSQDLAGRRFYSAGVIGGYCVLSLPVGLYLYGLNVARRGSRVMGYALTGASGLAFLAMLAATVTGTRASGFGLFGIFTGLTLLNMEHRPYRRSLARGGTPAKWWPPLLWTMGTIFIVLIVILIEVIIAPENQVK